MLQGAYSPSVFSRVVWLLLAINSFAGVVLSKGSQAAILLAGILLIGNLGMCIVSCWKGSKNFGGLEITSLSLLGLSGIVWVAIDFPLINLAISLLAHFVGALPTYKRVLIKPESESTGFWFLFFAASILSVMASKDGSFSTVILPLYFSLFDGSLFMLSLRKIKDSKQV